jgi:deoxyribodipyrimidine photolyase-related protein
MPKAATSKVRHLVIVLGDQLDDDSAAFNGFDPKQDVIWMAEVAAESTHVWTHKARIVMFLAAMRHFRKRLIKRGWTVEYRQLDDAENAGSLERELTQAIGRFKPQRLIMVEPGEWRVGELLRATAKQTSTPLDIRIDSHFLCTKAEFAAHACGRKQLRMEFFYREMRRKTGVLMMGDEPAQGQWNFDAENRGSFGKRGPENVPTPRHFPPDEITREVMALVEAKFPKHPGNLKHFDWPLTQEQAQQALDDFILHRLPDFGRYQDAMWTREPYLYHSRLSAAMNLKLIHPRTIIAAAEQAWRDRQAPIEAVEGFIRQILGWREYVRGIYWHAMPQYLERNALKATLPLPQFYWTGDTPMNCLWHAITQTLDHGYAHHIQRLMITGLFTLLLGVKPQAVHEWYLAVYVDAVEWVELPNTLGMSQYGDGGMMASKPYIASGKYIQRMSNYCEECRFNPAKATGDDACPFTTLYWDFLMRHEALLRQNQRMSLQVKNADRLTSTERKAIQERASAMRAQPA